MADLPPVLAAQDPPPGASYFATLRRFLAATRLSVAKGCGLVLTPGPGGIVLSYNPGLRAGLAVTTSEVKAFDPSTAKVGRGTLSLRRIRVMANGDAYLVAVGGPDVTGYSLDTVAVPSGSIIQYKIVDEIRVVDVQYCSTSSGST